MEFQNYTGDVPEGGYMTVSQYLEAIGLGALVAHSYLSLDQMSAEIRSQIKTAEGSYASLGTYHRLWELNEELREARPENPNGFSASE